MVTKRERFGIPYCTEHGIWIGMWLRCVDPGNKRFSEYGGRGISVCERWQDFFVFVEDVGRRPSSQFSLDRIDNDGNYEPANCKWSTRSQQNQNCRRTRRYSFDGESLTATEIGKRCGVDRRRLSKRLMAGIPVDQAIDLGLAAKKRQHGIAVTIGGVEKTTRQWAAHFGIRHKTAWQRVKTCGWSWERALTTPVIQYSERKFRRRLFQIGGITLGYRQWCLRYGISPSTVWKRMRRGLTFEQALMTDAQS